MGGQIPRVKKSRVVIQLAGPLSKANTRALKKELDRVVDKYRGKVIAKKPRRPKRQP